MKKKNLLLGLVLSLGFAGVGLGASLASSHPLMVAAEDAKSTGVYLKGSFNSWGTDGLMYFKAGTTYEYYITQAMTSGDTFKVDDEEHSVWVNTLDSAISSTLFSVQTSGDYNVVCNQTGLYKLTYVYTSSSAHIISSIEAQSSYSVSEYKVIDGVVGQPLPEAKLPILRLPSFQLLFMKRAKHSTDGIPTPAAAHNIRRLF